VPNYSPAQLYYFFLTGGGALPYPLGEGKEASTPKKGMRQKGWEAEARTIKMNSKNLKCI